MTTKTQKHKKYKNPQKIENLQNPQKTKNTKNHKKPQKTTKPHRWLLLFLWFSAAGILEQGCRLRPRSPVLRRSACLSSPSLCLRQLFICRRWFDRRANAPPHRLQIRSALAAVPRPERKRGRAPRRLADPIPVCVPHHASSRPRSRCRLPAARIGVAATLSRRSANHAAHPAPYAKLLSNFLTDGNGCRLKKNAFFQLLD